MKKKAPRNRTLTCTVEEIRNLSKQLLHLDQPTGIAAITDRIIHQDFFTCASHLPRSFADLVVIDPPYNLTKEYGTRTFRSKKSTAYVAWFDSAIQELLPLLKPDASVYVCSDWQTSTLIFPVLDEYFHVRNRITWEREKGRGSQSNWKNNTEDIWFCTMGSEYCFDVNAVKLKRQVIAPYRKDGKPKDWDETAEGNYRLTHPSNIWTDISIPFWSMPENTDHPTQKPEKLLAKLILASSKPGDIVFDPFAGSGTTAVTARKLNRGFVIIEQEKEYCCWAQKRLNMAEDDSAIQGYHENVFWERNTLSVQKKQTKQPPKQKAEELSLFSDPPAPHQG